MKRKRILLVSIGGFMGGIESYLENLAPMLEGHADVYAVCVLPELASRLRRKGLTVVQLPVFPLWLKALRFLVALFCLPFFVIVWSIDVVQVNGFLEAILILPARLLGREAIYTKHGPFEDELYSWYKNPGRFLSREASRVSALLANHVVCVSEAVGEDVRSKIPAERAVVIPNWVSDIPAYKLRGQSLQSPVRLLFVGRLEKYKGLHLLLEAMRELPDAALTVLGDGAYRPQLEELAKGLNVSFEGFQNDPQRYYDAADIFVMPSMGPEGLPMVAIEAMSQSLPCLFSDLAVHQEITDFGAGGMLFSLGDAQDLRQKLQVLLENPNLRMAYSKQAYDIVRRRYNPESAKKAYLSVFGLDEHIDFMQHEMTEELI